MLKRIILYFQYQFLKFIKPELIGNPSRLRGYVRGSFNVSNMSHVSFKNNNLKIGNNVFIGHFNYIDAFNAKLEIGDNVQITNYVSILTHSTHNAIRFSMFDNLSEEILNDLNNIGEIFIGENTYIGAHSLIMPGSSIGKNCIVSAYSYVKGNFPDYSIIRGIPAKIVGDTRDADEKMIHKYPILRQAKGVK